jgi:glycosyltransferase involved in cell wall biosynthesis
VEGGNPEDSEPPDGSSEVDFSKNIDIYSVSVIISTRNRVEFLKRCINSLLRQKLKPDEIIIIDDKSSDGTRDYLKELAKDSRRIIVVRNKRRKGPNISRNIGIKIARGDIVAFLDDDCIPEKDWLKHIVSHYDNPNVVGVGGGIIEKIRKKHPNQKKITLIGKNGDIYASFRSIENFRTKQRVLFFMGGNMSFRRSCLLEEEGFDSIFKGNGYREETDLSFRVKNHGDLIYEPKALVHHVHALLGGYRDYKVGAAWLFWFMRNTVLFFIKNLNSKSGILKAWKYMLKYSKLSFRNKKNIFLPKFLIKKNGIKKIFYILSGTLSGYFNGMWRRIHKSGLKNDLFKESIIYSDKPYEYWYLIVFEGAKVKSL